ncbi:MAG TPA: cupredoxin family copper-binding protein [Noviherbaspirillum sp.]|uniref:cupredoxin domain-containing protein n=1 Tax=Noviherbaspirillum sp. TaxID=1926288 RepID=UPI002B483A8D|nr:cupredoxin family copper-binding protein [Noviherbaspirillum sp.]HJV87460.1 cupredoxin family copper-binding protein [Noviherbaspirillum sp.]
MRTRMRHGGSLLLALALLGVSAGALADRTPARHEVVIEAMRYAPQTLEVKAGDTVVWTNKDPFPHTVTAQNHAFDSGEIAADGSWKFKPVRKGTFTYMCTLHPTMKATLIVR